jgi:hypothetical protein
MKVLCGVLLAFGAELRITFAQGWVRAEVRKRGGGD